MFFPTNSYAENFLVTFSTSGHDRKCFRFLKNIIKVYIWHVFWLILAWRIWWWYFQLPVITGSTSGFPKTFENVISTNICLFVSYNGQSRWFYLPIHVRKIFWSYFQLPVMTRSTSGFSRILKHVTSTCFPTNSSRLNSMKIFSTSGYDFRSCPVTSGLSRTFKKHDLNVVFE